MDADKLLAQLLEISQEESIVQITNLWLGNDGDPYADVSATGLQSLSDDGSTLSHLEDCRAGISLPGVFKKTSPDLTV